MTGQFREELGVQCAEQALDLATSLRPRDGGIDDAEAQAGRDLIKVIASEIAALIDVEPVWDAADGPGGIGLLPDRIGGAGAVAMNQLETVPEGRCALMRQRYNRRIEVGEDRIDRAVRRNAPALRLGDFADAPVNGSSRRSRLLQPHAFDERDESGRQSMCRSDAADGTR